MARIDIKSAGGGGTVATGVLQLENGDAMDTTLRNVADQSNTTSPLKLSTTAVQVTSPLRITTSDASGFYLDAEDSATNNRFSIKRDPSAQEVTLDFASNPAGSTTTVGAIRTYGDGVNLSNAVTFREDGQVTFTERVNVEADSLVTTESSSVIAASTTNANLVIAPNGTGALIASIPDGTATGGNARGDDAVDLQIIRGAATNVASGNYSVISGGQSNTASSAHSTVSGGQSNTASTGTHSTVVGGQSNTSSGLHSVSGGLSNTSSGIRTIALGFNNVVSGGDASVGIGLENNVSNSGSSAIGNSNTVSSELSGAFGVGNIVSGSGNYNFAFGRQNSFLSDPTNSIAIGSINYIIGGTGGVAIGSQTRATNNYALSTGFDSNAYLRSQHAHGNGRFTNEGDRQYSSLIAIKEDTLATGGTTVLSLDGTGVTNLIIPTGANRMWNVQVRWVAVVTNITGTATGVTIGDTKTSTDLLGVAKRGGVTTVSAHTSAGTHAIETIAGSLTAVNIAYTAGASQQMAITFTGPTFAGGGSVTMRIVAAISLTEVAY